MSTPKVKVTLQPVGTLLKARGLTGGGRVQQYIDATVLRLSDPYVSLKTGTLRNSGILHTDVGSGEVQYRTPYGAKQYYDGAKPGTSPSGGKRGRLWFERMKADHLGEIERGARRIAGAQK